MATATINPASQSSAKLLPFGKKAARFIARDPKDDARINVLVGSVRSAKTWSMMMKIFALCYYDVEGQRVLTGVSKLAIYRNVLNDLFEVVGTANYTYNRQSGELMLLGCRWVVIGAGDEGSEKAIRGMTIGAAVCDELVLMPQTFFKMLVSRMSPAGARLYATTNPDSPYHWVKTDVLDSEDYIHGIGKDLWSETFTFGDNPHLSEDYKQFLRRSYTGVWRDRFVLGLWVLASGAIYRDVLTEDLFYDDATRPTALRTSGHERWISIDYGTVNPCVFCEVFDDGKILWFDRSYYYDSRKEGRQKTDSEYADDLVKFVDCDERVWPGIILDPSAASFRAELLSRGFFVTDANNEVDDGIRMTSVMMANKKLRFHRSNVEGIQELQTYAWDTKKALNGKEQPIKQHDHYPDACRYFVRTRIGNWRLAA